MLTARAAAVIATEIFRIVPSLSLLFARSAVGGALDRAGRGVCVGAAALTRKRSSAECDLSALDHLPFSFWRVGRHAEPKGRDPGSLPRSDKLRSGDALCSHGPHRSCSRLTKNPPRGSASHARPSALKSRLATGPLTCEPACESSSAAKPKPRARDGSGARYQTCPVWSSERVVTGAFNATASVARPPRTLKISPAVVPTQRVDELSTMRLVVIPRAGTFTSLSSCAFGSIVPTVCRASSAYRMRPRLSIVSIEMRAGPRSNDDTS